MVPPRIDADPDVALREPGERDLGRRPYLRALLVTFVVAGGLAAYVTHLVVVFWGSPDYCGPVGVGTAVVMTALTALTAAAAVALGVRAVRRLRAGSPPPTWDEGEAAGWDPVPGGGMRRWWHVAGVFLSGHALLILLLVGVALVVLPTCV